MLIDAQGLNIYVDGSPGPKTGGRPGWGLVLLRDASLLYLACGGSPCSITSNQAELEALEHGLALAARLGEELTVWTDSGYVAASVSKLAALKANGFRPEGKKNQVANAARLEKISALLFDMRMVDRICVRWTKGHAKTVGNDIADKLAHKAAYENLDTVQSFEVFEI